MLSKKSTTKSESSSSRSAATRPSSSSRQSRREVTQEQIALRAYFISQSGTGGTPEENWARAERELRGAA